MSLEPSPFRGLAPFDEEDADLFFGREQEIQAVKNRLLVNNLTILHGVAGVGMTSFLRAGVARTMKQESLRNHEWLGVPKLGIVVFPQGENPEAWLYDPLGNLEDNIREQLPASSVHDSSPKQDRSFRDLLIASAAALDNPQGIGKLYLILDQFEIYLTQGEDDVENGSFLEILSDVIKSPEVRVHALIALESSALMKLNRLEGLLPDFWDNQYELKHFDKAAAKQAILGPIGRFNSKRSNQVTVSLEREKMFVEQILEDVSGQSHDRNGPSSAWKVEAPYLQLVMQRLWEEEGMPERSHVLQISTYQKLGRAEGIIQGYVDQCMSKLSQSERDMAARTLHQLLISARPARIDELVRHANDSAEDWQPKLRKKEVEQLITDHLAPSRIVRPLGHGEYECFPHTLREPLDKWVHQQQRSPGPDRLREPLDMGPPAATRPPGSGRRTFLATFGALTVGLGALILLLLPNYLKITPPTPYPMKITPPPTPYSTDFNAKYPYLDQFYDMLKKSEKYFKKPDEGEHYWALFRESADMLLAVCTARLRELEQRGVEDDRYKEVSHTCEFLRKIVGGKYQSYEDKLYQVILDNAKSLKEDPVNWSWKER